MTVDPNPIIRNWPEETRESAQLVIDNYGESDEATESMLIWHQHDEEANRLAVNLVDDIVAGHKSVAEARDYYAYEFLAYRKKEPTPYMDELRVRPQSGAGDPDERLLSDDQLQRAVEEGEAKG